MFERSLAAKYAISAFHEKFNDFNVYIEDKTVGYEKIFSGLIGRAGARPISLERVFPLGGRDEVLKAARIEIEAGVGRNPSVFLIDGDLNLLTNESSNIPANVVVLPRYCIENFLIDEDALVHLMDEEEPRTGQPQLRTAFDYKGWMDRSVIALKPLFIIFAVSHKLDSGVPTIGRGSKCICASHDGEIDVNKTHAIIDEIYNELIGKYGLVRVEMELRIVESNVDVGKCFVSTYVSAKDFILPYVIQRFRCITNSKVPNINLKLRLSKICNTTPMREVLTNISRIVGVDFAAA